MIESSLINGMATRDATGARIRFRGLEVELTGTVPIISTPIELIGLDNESGENLGDAVVGEGKVQQQEIAALQRGSLSSAV